MSQETLAWLNANVMYGYAATRSTWGAGTNFGSGLQPWFADPEYKHLYQDAIPVDDVISTLFHWTPVEGQVIIAADIPATPPNYGPRDGTDADGNTIILTEWRDTARKAIIRPDTGDVLGIFGAESYKIHDYREWLLDNVARILDTDELGISSAMLLRKGGQAAVTIELPDDIEVAGAGHIRVAILAATSLDGTLATVYKIIVMRPECDNSLAIALGESGAQVKIKHSARSLGRINDVRDTLGIIYKTTEQVSQFFDLLADVDVTDAQFRQIVSKLVPVPSPEILDGKVTNQRAITIADNKHADLMGFWTSDPRSAPWNGTLAGAYHSVSTWQQHSIPQDDNPFRRIMTGTISGNFAKQEQEFWSIVKDMDLDLPEALVL